MLRVHYTGTEADSAPYTAAHVDYLRRHHADGTFLLSGQTVPSEDGGVIVACGVDRDTAEAIAAQDPFVVAGVARYEITTVAAGRAHPGPADILAARSTTRA